MSFDVLKPVRSIKFVSFFDLHIPPFDKRPTRHFSVRNIFISCPELKDLYSSTNSRCGWHFRGRINTLTHLISASNQPRIHIIPKDWMSPAHKLAYFASNLHTTSLYHSGLDLPRWIMRCFYSAGFFFNSS